EYSALVASGRMTFADALRVVDIRGRGMQACADEQGGAMAAILGLENEVAEEICASLSDVWLANYNAPGQVVISGSTESVVAAGEFAKERGAARVILLPVSGAFHTPFMAGAAASLRKALAEVEFIPGSGRFFSTTELRYPEPGELAEVLEQQLMAPVKFAQGMEMVLQTPGAPASGLEVGPGNVLTGLLKRISRDLPMTSTGDGGALQKVLERLEGGK
ncbi:MAG: ACP S-malonyltransferase, partial [Thermoleophilia bacterium]|nr:ACP S-malonyltransferase [Thermoleophilia bacterium]